MVQWAVEGETATPVENRQMLSSIWSSRPPDPKQPPSQIAPTIVLYSVLLVWFVCLCTSIGTCGPVLVLCICADVRPRLIAKLDARYPTPAGLCRRANRSYQSKSYRPDV